MNPAVPWPPLEFEPSIINNYMYRLGVPQLYQMIDVPSFESEDLEKITSPIKSLLFMYHRSDAFKVQGDDNGATKEPQYPVKELYFMKQLFENAGIAIGIVHCVANSQLKLYDGVIFKYIHITRHVSPDARGKILKSHPAFIRTQNELAGEDLGASVEDKESSFNHFVALVNVNSELFEVDGKKSHPICHGRTSEATLFTDAIEVCKSFMKIVPDDHRFALMALTTTGSEE